MYLCACVRMNVCVYACVYVCVMCTFFIYILTFSTFHYKVILLALQLNIHNTVIYIYTCVQFLPFSTVTAGLISVF